MLPLSLSTVLKPSNPVSPSVSISGGETFKPSLSETFRSRLSMCLIRGPETLKTLPVSVSICGTEPLNPVSLCISVHGAEASRSFLSVTQKQTI